MITLKEIVTAINERLLTIAPDVEIQSNDISEGFSPSSFFVETELQGSQHGYYGRERTILIRIYYFPSDRHHKQQELLDMTEALELGFKGCIELKEGYPVFPSDFDARATDGVLQATFEIYLLEFDMTETGEDMNDLYLNVEKRD
ncbi:DUF6838 family protein [Mycolicibacterium fortuitum]|uniref:phage tail terminator family protein n=1 Tax=Paenibacillus sp. FSL W8-1287 TaxID=2954653 RepID=UPI001CE1F7CC|nr:hypothetical protein [Mycolicibacterium fortuitum]